MKKYFLLFAILFSKEDKENILLILDKDLSKKDVEIYSYKTNDLRNQFYLYITFKENTIFDIRISHGKNTNRNNNIYSITLNSKELEEYLASIVSYKRQKIQFESILHNFNFNLHEIEDIKRHSPNLHYNILSVYGNFDEVKVKKIISKHYNIVPEYFIPKKKNKSSITHSEYYSQIIMNLDYFNESLIYKNILGVMLYNHLSQNTDIIPKQEESKFTLINESFEFSMKINQTGDANEIKEKIESLIASNKFLTEVNFNIAKQMIQKHTRSSKRSAENNLKKYLIYGKEKDISIDNVTFSNFIQRLEKNLKP